ncbi:YqeG family HAD IIIA-type phosphatase [Macrococcus equipercicus]|uniref:YqeG family HAD IIIA-type phosphatase n=1 Tax=Macrococcus equipercicus TaxID=69967 RepID=A0ABQ6R9Q0_9STAP|nr:YqeG family HAD IIIA-type phosphatase [Macrococcus equipercicus]KAA1040041.1 YqeG family HAD IIIA-type phosphatase [Macrococcus equipercicus]
MGIFKKYLLPSKYAKNIFEITPEELTGRGVKAIITDLDNTLVGWDVELATEEVVSWFNSMSEEGIKVTIVSNNNEVRVAAFATPLKVDYIFNARKPMGAAFKKACRAMNVKPEETVVIGDQMMTDVLAANSNGFYSIMVVPVKANDEWKTRVNRMMERRFLAYFKRKGYINWEE